MARNSAPDVEFFAEICKVDEEQRTVFGYASTDCRDRQGEIVTKAAIAAALPDYMIWKNVREMHQPSAVGRAVEATMDDKGLYFGAYVADDRAWKKVKDKVYKGFSIGGRVTARDPEDKSIVTGVNITEISLVDRPANPEAKFDWFKRADDHLVFNPVQYWGCGCKDHQHLAKAEAQECMADQAADLQKRLDGGALLKFNQNHVESGPDGGQFADGSGGDGKDKEAMIRTQYGKRPAKNAETGKDAGKFQLKLASGHSPRAGAIAGKEGVHHADHFVDQYGNMHRVGKDGKMHEVQKLDEMREILKQAYADAEAMSKIDDDGFDIETGEFMGKRDFTQKEREHAASTGAAMPGGGYPIENTSDLHNAIQAYGRAKDPEATKRHIISRAKALGAEGELPDDWKKGDGDSDLTKATPRHIEGGRFAGHVKSAQEAEGMAKQYSELGDKAQKLHDKHMSLASESDRAGNPAGAAAHRSIAAAHKLNASRHLKLAKKYTDLANKHGEWANPNPGNGNDAVTVAKRAFASQLSKTKFTLAA